MLHVFAQLHVQLILQVLVNNRFRYLVNIDRSFHFHVVEIFYALFHESLVLVFFQGLRSVLVILAAISQFVCEWHFSQRVLGGHGLARGGDGAGEVIPAAPLIRPLHRRIQHLLRWINTKRAFLNLRRAVLAPPCCRHLLGPALPLGGLVRRDGGGVRIGNTGILHQYLLLFPCFLGEIQTQPINRINNLRG